MFGSQLHLPAPFGVNHLSLDIDSSPPEAAGLPFFRSSHTHASDAASMLPSAAGGLSLAGFRYRETKVSSRLQSGAQATFEPMQGPQHHNHHHRPDLMQALPEQPGSRQQLLTLKRKADGNADGAEKRTQAGKTVRSSAGRDSEHSRPQFLPLGV